MAGREASGTCSPSLKSGTQAIRFLTVSSAPPGSNTAAGMMSLKRPKTSASTSTLASRALVTIARWMSLCLCLQVSKGKVAAITTSPHTSTTVALPPESL